MLRALIVASDVVVRRILVRSLGERMAVDAADGLATAMASLGRARYDVVIAEERLFDGTGGAILAAARANDRRCRRALIFVNRPITYGAYGACGACGADVCERCFSMPRELTSVVLWVDDVRAQADRPYVGPGPDDPRDRRAPMRRTGLRQEPRRRARRASAR